MKKLMTNHVLLDLDFFISIILTVIFSDFESKSILIKSPSLHFFELFLLLKGLLYVLYCSI